MKIILSVIFLIAFVLVSMPMQSQAVNSMPLVGETRVMKDGAIGCDTRDAFKELMAFKDADKEDKINDLLERGVCSDLSGQQVEVVARFRKGRRNCSKAARRYANGQQVFYAY